MLQPGQAIYILLPQGYKLVGQMIRFHGSLIQMAVNMREEKKFKLCGYTTEFRKNTKNVWFKCTMSNF